MKRRRHLQKKTSNNSRRIRPVDLDAISPVPYWSDEPRLAFAEGREHTDPKIGIPLYGPRSFGTSRHPQEVHLGFIGTAEAVDHAQGFYDTFSGGVSGNGDHMPFPGFVKDRGYRSELRFDSSMVEKITRQEMLTLDAIRKRKDRFEAALDLLDSKLSALAGKDHPLDYVVVALSPELHSKCKVVDFKEKGIGEIHRDLRRAFKARAMKHRKPIQILLETTTGMLTTKRKLDHPSTIAWNLFNGLYFKCDGLPWSPTGLPPNSCFIGISFYRPLGQSSMLRTSVAQAFDENGEGLVLRGHSFEWNEDESGKSPHLTAELAEKLTDLVLEKYKKQRGGQLPQRVVIHKSSRFEDDECSGFEKALSQVSQYDLVALTPVSYARLIRSGQYPPLRGTRFTIGKTSYLYTTGYLYTRREYPHGHVPSPLQITDHVGDTPLRELAGELMVLTKMNWNSANFSGLMPITLRFSKLVGDILKEYPESDEDGPLPQYKYYM